jgi:hypothetical protein
MHPRPNDPVARCADLGITKHGPSACNRIVARNPVDRHRRMSASLPADAAGCEGDGHPHRTLTQQSAPTSQCSQPGDDLLIAKLDIHSPPHPIARPAQMAKAICRSPAEIGMVRNDREYWMTMRRASESIDAVRDELPRAA